MVKKQCTYCKPPNVGDYNDASKFSMSRHRRKYKCGLPRSVPSPPVKYHSNAAKKKGGRDRVRKCRENKKKVQPVTLPVALQRNVQLVTLPVAVLPVALPVTVQRNVQPVPSLPVAVLLVTLPVTAEPWYMTLTPGSPLKMATMDHLDDLLATTIPAVKRKKNKMTGVTKYTKVTTAKQMKV